jgi:WD40-like Beta Propeller Repeat
VPPSARHAGRGCVATLALVALLSTACLGEDTSRSRTDGQRLLFVAEDDGYVFTVGKSGQALEQLTRGHDWGARRGVWSPDGSHIAVVTDKVPEERNAAVLVMSRDGRNQQRLAFLPSAETQLSWRSERTIVARAFIGFHRVEVSTVDAVHGGRRRIVRIGRYRPGVLSPDGTQLAFDWINRHGDTQIYVARPDRSRAVNASRSRSKGPTPLVEAAETWSPDGTRLAFTLDRGLGRDTREVRVMQADGSNERTLALAPHLRGVPEWSPDGRSVAWVADADDDGLDELHVAPVNGDRPRRLVERNYIQDIEWEPGAARTAPLSAGSGPPPTRLIRTSSRELAKGHARLSDVRLLRRFASDSERPAVADLSVDGALVALIWRGEIDVLDLRTNRLRAVAPSRPPGGTRRRSSPRTAEAFSTADGTSCASSTSSRDGPRRSRRRTPGARLPGWRMGVLRSTIADA